MELAEYFRRTHPAPREYGALPHSEAADAPIKFLAPRVRRVFVSKLLVLVGTAFALATRDPEVAMICGVGATAYWLFFVKEATMGEVIDFALTRREK